jgi:hypothetical protein
MARFFEVFAFLCLSIILLASITDARPAKDRYAEYRDDTGAYISTREEILGGRVQRKTQMAEKISELQQQLDEHHSGERRLEESEMGVVQRRLNAHQRKHEQMKDAHLMTDYVRCSLGRTFLRKEISCSSHISSYFSKFKTGRTRYTGSRDHPFGHVSGAQGSQKRAVKQRGFFSWVRNTVGKAV